MQWRKGEYWLRDAVKYVRFPPDRRRVQEELYSHMIARNRDFLEEGYSEEEADRRSTEAMGDPEEVGRALAAVHRPFWGYFVLSLRIALVLALLISAAAVIQKGSYGGFYTIANYIVYRDLYRETASPVAQDAAAKCGDYRFRLRSAGLSQGGEHLPDGLILDLRASTWDPTLGTPRFYYDTLTLEDSTGGKHRAYVLAGRDLIFFSDLLVAAEGFDPASEWAVLSYDVEGRSFRLPLRWKGAAA
ncbi:MAG: hypothetical protein IKO91_01890 [Oscillospiraceae bacterium]|nr:hypothetical protein [Oscillospiraceae bacterium]